MFEKQGSNRPLDLRLFLAPTGSQGVKICVRPSVRPSVRLVQACLELSIIIILAQTQIVKLTSCELQAVIQQSFNSHHTVGALNTLTCF